MCLGVTTSSSDELILGSEGEYGSSALLEFFFRLRLLSSVDASRCVRAVCRFLSQAVRSAVETGQLSDFLTLCDELFDHLGGECWVSPTFGSAGSAARSDVLLEWRDECRVAPAFASVSALLFGCRCSFSSSSSDSSLSYCRIFLSLVLCVDSIASSSLQLESLRLTVWYTVSMISSSVLPVSGVLTELPAALSGRLPESGRVIVFSGVASWNCTAGLDFSSISGCREMFSIGRCSGKTLSTCHISTSCEGFVTLCG